MEAATLTTTFTSFGSGSIDGVAFLRKDVTVVSTADTSSRYSIANGFAVLHDTAFITIQDVGTFQITTPTRTFVNHLGVIGFSRQDAEDLLNLSPIGGTNNWDMLSAFPLTSSNGGGFLQWGGNFPDVVTSGGVLVMDGQFGGTFMATIDDASVPEPSTVALMACGLGVVAFVRRRR